MLSISHIIIIFIVALIVFGPEKLPELARTLGKIMAEFRRASMGFRQSLEENMRQLERDVADSRKLPPGPPAAVENVPSGAPAAVSESSKPAENSPDGNPTPA